MTSPFDYENLNSPESKRTFVQHRTKSFERKGQTTRNIHLRKVKKKKKKSGAQEENKTWMKAKVAVQNKGVPFGRVMRKHTMLPEQDRNLASRQQQTKIGDMNPKTSQATKRCQMNTLCSLCSPESLQLSVSTL